MGCFSSKPVVDATPAAPRPKTAESAPAPTAQQRSAHGHEDRGSQRHSVNTDEKASTTQEPSVPQQPAATTSEPIISDGGRDIAVDSPQAPLSKSTTEPVLTVPSSGGSLLHAIAAHVAPTEPPPSAVPTNHPDRPSRRESSEPGDLSPIVQKLKAKPTKTGGFSDVYEGVLTTTSELVAIKALRAVEVGHAPVESPEVRVRLDTRLKREMRVWKPLEHPRIVPCLGFAMVDGMPSLISPWYANGNAQDYVQKHPDCDRYAMIVQVAEGLNFLHTRDKPVVHYDVKSPNVLINDEGEAMLTDFGVAKVLEEARTGLTTSNATALSVVCSSPEAVQGEERNIQSDVYSYACFVLEMMTGKAPFYEMGKNTVKIVTAKIKGQTPDPKKFTELPEDDPLWPLLNRCWSKDPDSRPTMAEVLEELKLIGKRDQISAPAENAP